MLRMAGAVILIAGCSGFGWCVCKEMDGRIRQLHVLARAFAMLGNEVACSRLTLPEGMERVGRKLEDPVGRCFRKIGRGMKTGQEGSSGILFEEIWRREILDCLRDSCLKKRDRQMLLSFPDYVGFSDGQMQAMNLEQFSHEMENAEEKAMQDIQDRKKAVFSVSMTCGFLAAILLL